MTKFKVLFIFIVLITGLITVGCALFGSGEPERERYIVAFERDVDALIWQLVTGDIQVLEEISLIDAVLTMLSDDEVEWIEKNLPIRYIEPDMFHSIPEPIEVPEEIKSANSDPEIGWEIKMINAEAAWGRTKGQGVKVGIIDTGVDPNHPDLKDAIVGGYNGITDEDIGWEDDQGHGTSVAGVVAGRRNGTGIVGVAPLAKIYALKGLDKNGRGYSSWLLRCFQKALEIECDMVNCSWGSSTESKAISNAMENLAAVQGMGVICAAGNNGKSPIIWPARNSVAVCVTAIDANGDLASFSSFGVAVRKNGVAGPGVKVRVATMGGGTGCMSGTSFAAPYVTGLLALTKAMHWPARQWIFEGATQADSPDIYLGHGIINAGKTIDKLCEADDEMRGK